MVYGSIVPFQETAQPVKLVLKPGLYTEATDSTALDRWKDGDKVRFQNGLPQKLGGWTSPAVTGTLLGINRRVHEWRSLDRQNWIAIGTNSKLYVLNQGVLYDITPIRRQVSLGANPFATTNGSPLVVVTDAGHNAEQNDYVRFTGATAVAGLTIVGQYQIVSVQNNTTYTINAGSNANATTTGGGSAVVAEYDINNGGEDTGFAYGWGVCTWEATDTTWGTPRGACSTFPRKLRTWSLDNWGEDLVASPSGGAIYYWDRTLGPLSHAVQIDGAPITNQRILVSPQNRQLIALGAQSLSAGPDPLLIRVSNNEDFTDFVPAVLSGDESSNVFTKRIDSGSEIITGFRTRRSVIVFTDLGVHLMQPDISEVYTVDQLSEGNSIIGPNAGVEVNGRVFWMSFDKFMTFDGVVEEIPCDVWSKVFGTDTGQGINRVQADKVYCWHNDLYSEIWWQYPSAASNECDAYVIYNYREGHWGYGTINRTAGTRRSVAYSNKPLAWSSTGTLYKHEDGVDDAGNALAAYVETWDIELGDGRHEQHIGRAIPDNKYLSGTLTLTLKAKRRPEDTAYVSDAYSVTTLSTEFGTRSRGRQVAARFSSSAIGANWRIGPYRFYTQPDGER